MTRKRTGDPWMPSTQYGRELAGLTVNLLVREVAASLPFFTEVLGLKVVYSDPDFAALEFGSSVRMMLHADHAYDRFEPEVVRLAKPDKRGTGAEIRIMGPGARAWVHRQRSGPKLPARLARVPARGFKRLHVCYRSRSG